MCGIAGIFGYKESDSFIQVSSMVKAIHHRGPDDEGVWADKNLGLTLGHVRLSILDLSPMGHQPMVSSNGRYVITYNGEVYNFMDLQRELEGQGVLFRGGTDTEVLLAAIEEWGLSYAISRFIGMFAFGLWDREEHVLYLVRDRIGIKPLYFGWVGNVFVFGSELKALRAFRGFKAEIDRRALSLFMRYAYIPTPWSIYRNIFKLQPGALLAVKPSHIEDLSGFSPDPDNVDQPWKPVRYWSAGQVAEQGTRSPFRGSGQEAVEQLEVLLTDAVRLRMISDVPLGVFLSGGVDSSTVVALMQAQSDKAIKTFTIGFHEKEYNEAHYARKVARHLGTDHTELYVTPTQALEVVPKLPNFFCEPFGDSSQIPTFLVSELTKRDVTVVLSGDGGDELFGGYARYFIAQSIWKNISWIPKWLRRDGGRALASIPPKIWPSIFRLLWPILPSSLKGHNSVNRVNRLAKILALENPESMYLNVVSFWDNPEALVLGAREPLTVLRSRENWASLPTFMERMMHLDSVSYLPDDILVKMDRASMSVGLEAREPLLDHRVIEFSWKIPLSMKVREGNGKWLLRQVLYKYVPQELIDRPKMGFGIPLNAWLRGPLREWAEELLDEKRLQREGFFDPAPVRLKWTQHLSGAQDWQYLLWNVLMFQAWLEKERE